MFSSLTEDWTLVDVVFVAFAEAASHRIPNRRHHPPVLVDTTGLLRPGLHSVLQEEVDLIANR